MKHAGDILIGFVAATTIAILMVVSVPAVTPTQTMMNRIAPFNFYTGSPRISFRGHRFWVLSSYTKVSDGKGHIRHILAESSISSLSFRVTGTGPHLISRNDNDYFFSEIRGPEYNFAHGLIPSHPEGLFGHDSSNNAMTGYINARQL